MKMILQVPQASQIHAVFQTMSKRATRPVVINALMEGGELMRARASQLAPREPGAPDLAQNINLEPLRGTPDGMFTVGIGVPKRFFYDFFQEYGTSRHGAQPFYRPAFDGLVQRAIEIISAAMWRAIRPDSPVNIGSRNL